MHERSLAETLRSFVSSLREKLAPSGPPPHDPPKLGKKIVILSDTHGQHRRLDCVPDGDILIHAGDWTRFGNKEDVVDFNEWLGTLPHRYILCVEGNHEYNASWMKSGETGALLSNAIFL